MSENVIEICFEGYFLCRLATDPDPSLEERGISGFTYAVAGETLLDPSILCQPDDIENLYGQKPEQYRPKRPPSRDSSSVNQQFDIVNIREASPDYERYNSDGIGIKVTEVKVRGERSERLTKSHAGHKVRFTSAGVPGHDFVGPIFEGRNQITSDGDPDRFTVNPFVIEILGDDGTTPVIRRFDPLDPAHPEKPLWEIPDASVFEQRLPSQRFPTSQILLDELGIKDATQHFVNRSRWLEQQVAEAEAEGNEALAEAYRSRQFGVDFFTEATGPTVLQNRLASRIPLRQLYVHPVRGAQNVEPLPIADSSAFDPEDPDLGSNFRLVVDRDWEILYYLGAYDGDLMVGFADGCLTVPFDVDD
jgi:hypothetical protein